MRSLPELLIFAGVVLAPWMFGSTQPWSIWTMNAIGYALGALTLISLLVRRRSSATTEPKPDASPWRTLAIALGCANVLALAHVLISAVNAAADYDPRSGVFAYREEFLRWLPHSFHREKTWQYFWNYLALACFFWGTVNWLRAGADAGSRRFIFVSRIRRLLWVLTINGALVAVEGIIQRMEGSGKLLFLVQPRVNPGAEAQFGPFAYRANAAQYLNLIWPVTIGFWLSLHRALEAGARFGSRSFEQFHHTLIPLALVMAVAPLVSTSRGGALVLLGQVFAVSVVIWIAFRDSGWPMRWGVPAVLLAALGFGVSLGWKRLNPRIEDIGVDFLNREGMYDTGARILREYPWFGTGPGSLDAVFQLYRESPDEYWPVQLHNDWLETLVTFGWTGALLIWLALAIVLVRWFFPGRMRANPYFVSCLWIALAGCLIHARWDFPFQIYSVTHLFLTMCAMLFCLSRKTR